MAGAGGAGSGVGDVEMTHDTGAGRPIVPLVCRRGGFAVMAVDSGAGTADAIAAGEAAGGAGICQTVHNPLESTNLGRSSIAVSAFSDRGGVRMTVGAHLFLLGIGQGRHVVAKLGDEFEHVGIMLTSPGRR